MKTRKEWYRLDNAAKIYPSVITSRLTAVFRISVTLTEFIDHHLLLKAVNSLLPRFPYYCVKLKSGIFWHYLEHNTSDAIVFPETEDPCRKINTKKNNGFLFRVLYFKKRISLEISHIITDGTGGLIFMNAIILEYLTLKGIKIQKAPGIPRKNETAAAGESEDGYNRYYKLGIPLPYRKESAFHLRDKKIDRNLYNIITGIIELKPLLKKCKEKNVSLTEFIISLYIRSMIEYIEENPDRIRKKDIKPIRIMVPVNLRKIYPSISMRNFFLTVMPGIDPRLGEYTFDEILKIVYHTMRVEVDNKFINQQITRNVGSEKNPFVRIVPLIFKLPAEKTIYSRMSAREHSGVITNIGRVDLPEKMAGHIERYEFIPNPNPYTVKNIGIISFNSRMYISFGSLTNETGIEKTFFRNLRKMNIPVKIETNME